MWDVVLAISSLFGDDGRLYGEGGTLSESNITGNGNGNMMRCSNGSLDFDILKDGYDPPTSPDKAIRSSQTTHKYIESTVIGCLGPS